jgi:polyisoprenoid-binding protein YceI
VTIPSTADQTQTALQPQTDTQTQPKTWQIDAAHSLVEFSVRHMMVSTAKGRFADFAGSIVFDPQNPSASSVNVQIQANSVTTADPKRDEHLRSADFFDAETFPTLSFQSTRVEPIDAEHVRIVGDLTIKDTTREITLDAELNGQGVNPWGKQVVGFSAHTALNRKDYGLNWNVALEAGGVLVSDTIKVSLEIEATA